jgi:hypothetical protein
MIKIIEEKWYTKIISPIYQYENPETGIYSNLSIHVGLLVLRVNLDLMNQLLVKKFGELLFSFVETIETTKLTNPIRSYHESHMLKVSLGLVNQYSLDMPKAYQCCPFCNQLSTVLFFHSCVVY